MSEKVSFGEKCAEIFANIFASWRFCLLSLSGLNIWAVGNALHIFKFDPDLAFANFNLSQLTYFVDIVIIMNQVRQTNMDRKKLNALQISERNIIKEILLIKSSTDDLHHKIDQLKVTKIK